MIKRFAGRALLVASACITSVFVTGAAFVADAAPAATPAADAKAAAPVQLADDHPTSYTVQPGDTLWGISEKFLKNPWQWPEVWHINEQVANPHLIYPGNVIRLVWRDGRPSLETGGAEGFGSANSVVEVISADTVKMRPRIRDTEMAAAIPAIPLRSIEVFLNDSRVVTLEELKAAPYVLAGQDRRVVLGGGDTLYARSTQAKWNDTFPEYGVFRQGAPYLDPVTREVLGYEAKKVGVARVLESKDAVATMRLLSAEEDVRINDRLLLNEQRKVQSVFYPKPSPAGLEAQIIHIFGTIGYAGRNDVVVLNKGLREKVDVGQVFSVMQKGEVVRDRLAGDVVTIPATRAGLLIVFRAFDKVSYGLITRATRPVSTGDLAVEPRINID